MPLIDAYMKCSGIAGSYNPSEGALQGASAKLQVSHKDWSEIYSLNYSLSGGEFPHFTIKKPVDAASNDLYLLFLKTRARDIQKGKKLADQFIEQIEIELCRWVDTNSDGIVDEFKVFIKYKFEVCRVMDYSTGMDFEADDLPDEEVSFGFKKIQMFYYNPEEELTYSWDFSAKKEVWASK
jgi:type VI protein secretion system component Hcp